MSAEHPRRPRQAGVGAESVLSILGVYIRLGRLARHPCGFLEKSRMNLALVTSGHNGPPIHLRCCKCHKLVVAVDSTGPKHLAGQMLRTSSGSASHGQVESPKAQILLMLIDFCIEL
jgi:hypothetical protein